MCLEIVLCIMLYDPSLTFESDQHVSKCSHDFTLGIDPEQGEERSKLLFVGASLCHGVVPLPALRKHTPCISHRELPRQSGGAGRTY